MQRKLSLAHGVLHKTHVAWYVGNQLKQKRHNNFFFLEAVATQCQIELFHTVWILHIFWCQDHQNSATESRSLKWKRGKKLDKSERSITLMLKLNDFELPWFCCSLQMIRQLNRICVFIMSLLVLYHKNLNDERHENYKCGKIIWNESMV